MRSALIGSVPLDFAAELQKDGPVQGNLDPMRMVAGGTALEEGIDDILRDWEMGR